MTPPKTADTMPSITAAIGFTPTARLFCTPRMVYREIPTVSTRKMVVGIFEMEREKKMGVWLRAGCGGRKRAALDAIE